VNPAEALKNVNGFTESMLQKNDPLKYVYFAA
jgi:hypothetical protein